MPSVPIVKTAVHDSIYVLTVSTISICSVVDSSLSVLRRMEKEASWLLGNGFPTSHVIMSSSFNEHDCYNTPNARRIIGRCIGGDEGDRSPQEGQKNILERE